MLYSCSKYKAQMQDISRSIMVMFSVRKSGKLICYSD